MERSGLVSEQPVSFTPVPSGVMQRCACGGMSNLTGECAACRQKREVREGALQRRAAGPEPVPDVPPMVHDVLRSPGQPLDSQTRAFMEPRFGHDFSNVRIHSDPAASASARAVQAHAYTVGQHVVFGTGAYQPSQRSGQALLAHELTHTIQQQGAGQMQRLSIAEDQSPLEQEAQQAAQTVLAGGKATARLQTPRNIQRAPWGGGICPPGEQVPANDPFLYGPAELVMVNYYRTARPPAAVNEFVTNFDALEQLPTTGTQGPMIAAMQKHFRSGKNPSWRRKGQTAGDADKTPAPTSTPDQPLPSTDPSDLTGGLALDDPEFELLRPDILDVKRREVYDVTTRGLAAAKVNKVQGYVRLLETIRVTERIAGPAWSAGTTLQEPPGVFVRYPLMPGITLCFSSTDLAARAGVLSYEVVRQKNQEREKDKVDVPVPLPLSVPQGQGKPVPLPQPKSGPVTVPDGKPVPMPNPDVKPDAKPVSVPDDGGGKVLPFKPRPKPDAAPVPDSDALPIAAMVALATGALWALSRQGAKRAGGAAVGKALVYAEMAAALVLVMFYSDRAEAKPGPGDSALEGLFKAMSQQGTPIPAELRQKIESDPKLKKLLESAASGQDISAAQAELNRQMAEEINAHLDEFSQEDLELLLQTTGSIQANPKTAPTIETIKKAIEAKKNGASGTGKEGGSGSTVKDQASKDPVNHPQAKDTSSLAPKPDAGPKPVSPSPVDRLVAGMASPSADGPQMTSTLRARLLALASATVPPLTDEDVTTLLQHLVSAKGKTEDEIVNSIQQGIQGLRQSKGQTTSTDPMEKNTNADFVENQSAKGSVTPTPGTKTVSHDEFIKKMLERINTYSGWSKISIENGIMKRSDGQSFSTVKTGETIQVEYYEYRARSNKKSMRGTANLTIYVKSLNKVNKTMDVTILTKNSLIVIEDGSTKPMEISGGTIKLF